MLGEGLQATLHLLQLPAEVQDGLLVLLRSPHVTVHVLQDVLDSTVHFLILREKGRKEGRKEERKKGRKEGRKKEGRKKGGRKEVRKKGRKKGRKE